ncbi:hypothetical protein CN278_06205 [Bacillus thuringiensis]|nr:hypothetical protein F8510_30105 [Bacillus sp. RM2(2019)]MBR9664147.1 hypothetical protein [Bacillus cereus]OTW95528.1 hypothetical protein BK711_21045 [Bacillus thuringiensis serovar fukuokaensis]PFD38578.1 hypothetical protein CN278_06205 [Bacillus thuringiensis]PFE59456.1 hypothetical protein CN322_28990 [Bacillus thuringiensis]
MSTKFFISFVACDVNVIGDLFYITPLISNRQYVFIKNIKRLISFKISLFITYHSIHLLFFYNW